MKIIIGSRGSDLALWQARHVQGRLREAGHEAEIKIILTKGDRIQHLSFDKMEGKGFFTKEIEEALLNKEIDLAVHSHKDLETTSPPGLMIAAVSERENPSDCLLIRKSAVAEGSVLKLKDEAVVGTSSARRQSQLLRFRKDIQLKDLRGNVPTRINKLREGQYDAIVLATAGLRRLKLDVSDLFVLELDPTEFVPAPAQGVLGLQIRENDSDLKKALGCIHQTEVMESIRIEREVLRLLDGGCQLPLGVYCHLKGDERVVYTAFSPSREQEAILQQHISKNPEGLPQTIVDKLQRVRT